MLRGGVLDGERLRVFISTDIGGFDPDDCQSMVHLFMYADTMDIEGLVSSPPGKGRVKDIFDVIDAYQKDYPVLKTHSKRYPAPDALRKLVKQGAIDAAPPCGYSKPTDGSRLLIEHATADDPRPLYVLVWGSITDVAQALHDDPSIKRKIRVYFISSWNRRMDPTSREYIYRQHPDLWMIECDTTFRGMYIGGDQSDDLGNLAFVKRHVKDRGALGAFYYSKKHDIKMGDTPSVLYIMRGNPDDPTAEHWGGAFLPTNHGPHYWIDNGDPELREREFNGAKTVNKWRVDYLRDWQKRMERLPVNK